MDPHGAANLSPEVLRQASETIGRGLTWVFGAMLLAAAAQTAVTLLLPPGNRSRPVRPAEAMEAMAG